MTSNCYRSRHCVEPQLNVSICNIWGPFCLLDVTDRDKPFEGNPNISICNSKTDIWVLDVTDRDNLGADAPGIQRKTPGRPRDGRPSACWAGFAKRWEGGEAVLPKPLLLTTFLVG